MCMPADVKDFLAAADDGSTISASRQTTACTQAKPCSGRRTTTPSRVRILVSSADDGSACHIPTAMMTVGWL